MFKRTKKMNNSFTEYNGHMYHSKSEAYYAKLLDEMLEKGLIKSIERQKKYPLANREGKMRMAYIADFVVVSNTDKEYVIDVKGMFTQESNVKIAYFTYVYKKVVHLVWTTGLNKFDTKFIV